MTANERYEKAWDSFLVYLYRNPKPSHNVRLLS